MTVVALIVAGIVIGGLARLFVPGRQKIGLIATVVVGILGTLIGYWIAKQLGVADTKGIDWMRWIISIVVSAVLVSLTAGILGRRSKA